MITKEEAEKYVGVIVNAKLSEGVIIIRSRKVLGVENGLIGFSSITNARSESFPLSMVDEIVPFDSDFFK